MSTKPIFVATHPRACSTAFERVFMTRDDILSCVHEPFGDAFYFGPERMSPRYDETACRASCFAQSTFKSVLEAMEREGEKGKRLFIKDITHYLIPPGRSPPAIAPSLVGQYVQNSHGLNDTLVEHGNPTVVPAEVLEQFHFTFLIRHPRHSIPSYWRCTVKPLNDITGFHDFMPNEAGYDELRRFFDFLREKKLIGPSIAGQHGSLKEGEVSITVIDADDLLDNPEGIIKAYCKEVGIDYQPEMLVWDTEESHERAKTAFEKWKGFHEDAINSTSLKPRSAEHRKIKTVESENEDWRQKYGDKAQRIIRDCVDANIPDYEYLRAFAIKV